MSPQQTQSLLAPLYESYLNAIKPLIAEIEARTEKFPLPLFNEIRAFNDHVARCYSSSASDNDILGNIQKAEGHITRIVLDCYKYLNVFIYEEVKKFEKSTKNIDLTNIDNGTFWPEYKRLCKQGRNKKKEAKTIESINKIKALQLLQEAYNIYVQLENLIDNQIENVKWARVKHRLKIGWRIFKWLVGVAIGAFLATLFSCEYIRNVCINIFGL